MSNFGISKKLPTFEKGNEISTTPPNQWTTVEFVGAPSQVCDEKQTSNHVNVKSCGNDSQRLTLLK